MKYIDVSRTTYTSLSGKTDGRSLEREWEERNVRSMDRIHEICPTEDKVSRRTYMIWEDLQGNKKLLVLTLCDYLYGCLFPMQRKRKQNKEALRRTQNSTVPDNWKEYSPLRQTMKNSSSQWKWLVESCKFRCQQLSKYRHRAKIKYACIVVSTRARDQLDTNLIKIRSLQKGWILWLTTDLFISSFQCLKH